MAAHRKKHRCYRQENPMPFTTWIPELQLYVEFPSREEYWTAQQDGSLIHFIQAVRMGMIQPTVVGTVATPNAITARQRQREAAITRVLGDGLGADNQGQLQQLLESIVQTNQQIMAFINATTDTARGGEPRGGQGVNPIP